jgi:tyrosyl-tRNA synthetase
MFSAFTFLEKTEIDELVNFHMKNPEKREGQKKLAKNITCMLFGELEAKKCLNNCEAHYLNSKKKLNKEICEKNILPVGAEGPGEAKSESESENEDEIERLIKNGFYQEISEETLDNLNISSLCVDMKILPTKAQCKRLIQSGSVMINNKIIEEDCLLSENMFLCKNDEKYLILKTGKKHTHYFKIKSLKKEEYDSQNERERENNVLFKTATMA